MRVAVRSSRTKLAIRDTVPTDSSSASDQTVSPAALSAGPLDHRSEQLLRPGADPPAQIRPTPDRGETYPRAARDKPRAQVISLDTSNAAGILSYREGLPSSPRDGYLRSTPPYGFKRLRLKSFVHTPNFDIHHVELEYVSPRAEKIAKTGLCATKVAVDELLDVGSGGRAQSKHAEMRIQE